MVVERSGGRRDEILAEAHKRYGDHAEFVYINGKRNEYVALTLEDAMQICGDHIINSSSDELWGLLDQMHGRASKLQASSHIEAMRANGRAALGRTIS